MIKCYNEVDQNLYMNYVKMEHSDYRANNDRSEDIHYSI